MGQNSTKGERNARVVLRRLSVALPGSDSEIPGDGIPLEGLSGKIVDRESSRLSVELDPLIAAHVVAPGDLVEVRTGSAIYLGQVRARRDLQLTIALEHSLDVASLNAIQRVWNLPGISSQSEPEESADALAPAVRQVPS